MRGTYNIAAFTLIAVMLNSKIIKWQHRLLAKGYATPVVWDMQILLIDQRALQRLKRAFCAHRQFLPDNLTADVAVVLGYKLDR